MASLSSYFSYSSKKGLPFGFIAALSILLASCSGGFTPLQQGEVIRLDNFESQYISPRHVEVYLPFDYHPKDETYPVIYLQDGQNVFNPKTSFTGIDWGVDEAMDTLIYQGKVPSAIVVAVWNSRYRRNEYMPEDPLPPYDSLKQLPEYREFFNDTSVFSNRYLAFFVEELMPYMDDHYALAGGPENTFLMGSSMGGLISAYALAKHPDLFGKAACLSTHWPAFDGICIDYFARNLPAAKDHAFYFDHGTETLDADYAPYQKRMDEALLQAGYVKGENFESRVFEGAAHNEEAWRARVKIPLQFLLKDVE